MKRTITVIVTVALLAIVISVFVAPAIDLDPTAFRITLWIVALFASLELVKIALSGFEALGSGKRIHARDQASKAFAPLPIDLGCARLC